MVTEEQALAQVLRFEHYAGFPTEEERPVDQGELVLAFEEAARDTQHAIQIGDWLIRHRSVPDCRFCPVPAEVYAAAEATRPAASIPEMPREAVKKQPGDTPFNGFGDLIDARLIELLKRRAESAPTHTEREDAKRLLAICQPQHAHHA